MIFDKGQSLIILAGVGSRQGKITVRDEKGSCKLKFTIRGGVGRGQVKINSSWRNRKQQDEK
jgi:hypothetical protein